MNINFVPQLASAGTYELEDSLNIADNLNSSALQTKYFKHHLS